MIKQGLFALLLIAAQSATAQDDAGYKTPPKDIVDLVSVKPTPSVSISENGEWMLFLERNSYPSIEELAQPELKIAGLRINPKNFAPSRQTFINNLYLKSLKGGPELKITGLPSPLSASGISWSDNSKKIAVTNTTNSGTDLYVIDVATRKAVKVNKQPLNTIMNGMQWFDNNTLLYYTIVKPASAAPAKPLAPKGPTIQENYGKASPRPTYQDMIKSPYDEELFAFYATTQLVKNVNGVETKIGQPAIYADVNISPDKKYLLTRTLKKPFSYLVPASGFNSSLQVLDATGKLVKHITNLPSSETAPGGNDNVQPGPRSYTWRSNAPASLLWCEALDSGLIKNKAEFRDAVYELKAPFTGKADELFKTRMRYFGTTWSDGENALVTEGLRSKQVTQIDRYFTVTGDLETLITRNTTDAYNNPGMVVTAPNQYGRNVAVTIDNGNKILFNNPTGSSPKGDLPFLISFDLHTKKADTLWRSKEGTFESITRVLDPNKLTIITRKETENEVPNYWLKNLRLRVADQQLTSFTDPYPQLKGVSKEKISYQREDGVTLTGDLYLPKGYDAKRDGPLPVFIWAYPAEYNSAADAAQIRGSKHRFTLLNWGSPVYYVTQGYAVLNNAEMPIVATDTAKKPNDNFVEQLRMNAAAAINKLAALGVGDSTRVAVGGHSYGAFMTANLLAHTNLFKGGIARSGAYNRTLTPFGFQNEDRTYWQAPELYNNMSPFSYADKIKTPLLLIHGEADNNTGTYPIQSERMFNAIKGHGGTVKFVSLPFESHGYQAKESIMHTLAEQFEWLEKYVKNPPAQPLKKAGTKAF
ncbi:prolyl oligopeptidase family serine peptidase [Terrimonas rubra]|uniref:Prolyl oligopeptidase family serine peptidase n=1 Tax=Terrimonas rubra TaxID=1035890 RepID=A0ABW6A8J7_9BACT